jgi:hypothetical protein
LISDHQRYDKTTHGGVKQKQRHLPVAFLVAVARVQERIKMDATCRRQDSIRGGPKGPLRTKVTERGTRVHEAAS